MGLLLRYSAEEGVLRSVGDAPNGILGIAAPNDIATFVIDSSWTPPTVRESDGALVEARPSRDGIDATSTPVSVGDAVDACEGDQELGWLLRAPSLALCAAAQVNAGRHIPFEVLFVRSHVDLIEAMRDALIDRGHLTYSDG